MSTGRPDLAIQYYRQALEYDPSSAAAQSKLDIALRQFSGNVPTLPPIVPPAVRSESAPAPLDTPPRPSGNEQLAAELYMKGLEAYRQGNRLDAVDYWQRAVEAAPGSETAKLAQEAIQKLTAR